MRSPVLVSLGGMPQSSRQHFNMYLLVGLHDAAEHIVAENFRPGDRCEVFPGAWLVRSEEPSCSTLSDRIGISEDRPGILLTVTHYSGWVADSVIETLAKWQQDDG